MIPQHFLKDVVLNWVRRGEYYRFNLPIDSVYFTENRDFRAIKLLPHKAYFTKPISELNNIPDAVPYEEDVIEREVLLEIDTWEGKKRVGVGYGALTKTLVIFER